MKTIRTIVLSFFLIAFLLEGQSLALPGQNTTTRANTLTELFKKVQKHTDLCEREFSIDISTSLYSKQIEQSFLNDIFVQNGVISMACRSTLKSSYVNLKFYNMRYSSGKRCAYAFLSDDMEMLNDEELLLLKTAKQITDSFEGEPEEIEKQIHDYICDNVEYNNAGNDTQTYHQATGAILEGIANADGFADAFYLMCTLKGLEVMCVAGTAVVNDGIVVKWIWNAVKLGDKWYMTDVTMDEIQIITSYLWYNLGSDMMSADHTWPDYIPVTMSEKTFQSDRFITVNSIQEMEQYLIDSLESRPDRVSFLMVDTHLDYETIETMIKNVMDHYWDKHGVVQCIANYKTNACEIILIYADKLT